MYSTDYDRIYDQLKSREDIGRISKEEGVEEELLLIILSQKLVRDTKREYYAVKKKAPSLLGEWMHGRRFVELAREHNFSPVLTASLMLQHTGVSKKQFRNYINNPEMIPDKRLRVELTEAIREELIYSPDGTRIQRERGKDVEMLVKKWLDRRKVKYMTEKDAKKGNYTKTPDFKLESPLKHAGKWLNWIECKASFGDQSEYKRDYGKQLSHYVSLFGVGMVVYWYGYIEDMPNHLLDDNVVITDRRLFEQ
jgi:hypothetical protein